MNDSGEFPKSWNVPNYKKSRQLTERQQRFVRLKTTWPYPSSAKAARLSGYSESVARHADRIISSSPIVRLALEQNKEAREIPMLDSFSE